MNSETALPLISICLPTYNGLHYLEETLFSIESQTYTNIEIVISDNDSTDGSMELIANFRSNTRHTTSLNINPKIGIGSNWNNAISHASGEYIKLIFQDDLMKPDCLEKLILPFLRNPELGMTFCNKELIGRPKKGQEYLSDQMFERVRNMKSEDILRMKDLYKHPRNKIGEPPCTLIRREVFEVCGYFNEQLEQSLDYEFWYRILDKYPIKAVDEKLIQFRIHPGQTSYMNEKRTLIDSYLMPQIMLMRYIRKLHPVVVLQLIYKMCSGWLLNLFKMRTKHSLS